MLLDPGGSGGICLQAGRFKDAGPGTAASGIFLGYFLSVTLHRVCLLSVPCCLLPSAGCHAWRLAGCNTMVRCTSIHHPPVILKDQCLRSNLCAQGDLIPWTIGQQYQDQDFPVLSGARVVRIAVHPEMPRQGYGSRALELLRRYYQGELADLVSAPSHSIREAASATVCQVHDCNQTLYDPPLLHKDNTLAPLLANSAHMWCVSRLKG